MQMATRLPQAAGEHPSDIGSAIYECLELEKSVLNVLLAWANKINTKTAPKGALSAVLHYLRQQQAYLVCYLEDSRFERLNNNAELNIKPLPLP